MKHRIRIDADVLSSLKHCVRMLEDSVEPVEASADEGKRVISRSDITCEVTEDGEYVLIEDVANGGNLIEVPSDWFEEWARKFLRDKSGPVLGSVYRTARMLAGRSLRAAAFDAGMDAVRLGEIERGVRYPEPEESKKLAQLYSPAPNSLPSVEEPEDVD